MFFSCICVWKTVYQHYSSSFVDTLLSTALHPSFHQMLDFALLLSAVVESYQIKFSLPEDNYQVKIPSKIHSLWHHNKKLFSMYCNVFCEDSTEFPGIRVSYGFYRQKNSSSTDNLLWRTIFSCNLLIFGYSPGIEQSRISYFQTSNTIR